MDSVPASESSETPGNTWTDAYPSEAFDFVQSGVEYTVSQMHGEQPPPQSETAEEDGNRHVDGRQLSEGLRELAIRRFGLLAPEVLRAWNIHRTDDFGRIVYALIEGQELYRSDQDRIEDFFSVYDFDEAFSELEVKSTLGRIRDDERIRG